MTVRNCTRELKDVWTTLLRFPFVYNYYDLQAKVQEGEHRVELLDEMGWIRFSFKSFERAAQHDMTRIGMIRYHDQASLGVCGSD